MSTAQTRTDSHPTPVDDDVEVGRRYAQAYAGFDVDTLRAVLAPDLRLRQVNPGGYMPLPDAEAYIAATAEFLAGFDHYEAAVHDAERCGDRIIATARTRLSAAGRSYLMEHREVLTVQHGKVVGIDGVCTGARPA